MAGKHPQNAVAAGNTASIIVAWATVPPWFPGGRLDKAYAEGRQADADGELITADPHPSGTPESTAWTIGYSHRVASTTSFAGTKFQTGVPDG